jgi:hypothetical protein
MKGDILNENAEWTVFQCSADYSIQAIISNQYSKGWNSEIHAFGHGSSKNEINKLLKIYATLNKK